MQFALTQEQTQLQDGVQRFVREHYGLQAWRLAARQAPGFREALWRQMADMGWLAVGISQAHGGLGMGARELGVVMENLGAGLVLEPYFSSAVLGAKLLQTAGSDAQCREMLPQVADGSLRLTLALHEPGMRYDWTRANLQAHADGDGWRLSGEKSAVLDGPSAQRLLVVARASEGLALFCVDAEAQGLRRKDYPTVDERRCSDFVFDQVRVGAGQRLAAQGDAQAAVQEAIDWSVVALGAEAMGAMSVLLQSTVDYLKTRKQFGRPLSEFQALRHRVADMLMAIEQTRSLVDSAAMALDAQSSDASARASAAKVQAGQAGRFVGESAVQLHGGIGMTDELHLGHYVKRLMAIDFLLGDSAYHLQRFAGLDREFSALPGATPR